MTQMTYTFDENIPPLLIAITPASESDISTDGAWKETSSLSDKIVQGVVDVSQSATESVYGTIFHMARYTSQLIRRLRETESDVPLDAVEMQFGLSFGAEGKIIFVNGTAEANLSVKLTWKEK